MISKNKLTKRQTEIFNFIVDYVRERGYAPSYREIASELGMSSTATVHEHVKNLETKGYLADGGEGSRTIEVEPTITRMAQAITVPLAGVITAGEPIEAIQSDEGIDVPASMVAKPEDTFVLKVRGDSMIEDGILSGDYVVVERNPSPKNGDIVVALLDNMYATLKRFYREPGRVRLQPANSRLKPIYVREVVVQGVVRGLMRDFGAHQPV
ncbi:transcriptional repressor LexA [Candidatus Uhrbacteria bacterium]|nr:transcriptional repressor LexA [Candidatus Uhrbacteria bacterium]